MISSHFQLNRKKCSKTSALVASEKRLAHADRSVAALSVGVHCEHCRPCLLGFSLLTRQSEHLYLWAWKTYSDKFNLICFPKHNYIMSQPVILRLYRNINVKEQVFVEWAGQMHKGTWRALYIAEQQTTISSVVARLRLQRDFYVISLNRLRFKWACFAGNYGTRRPCAPLQRRPGIKNDAKWRLLCLLCNFTFCLRQNSALSESTSITAAICSTRSALSSLFNKPVRRVEY